MKKYKNLFIDLDDTLWDTYHNNKECLREIYADYRFGRHYPSFEAFFDTYMPNNYRLWELYRNNLIDRRTLILERFRFVLRPLGIEDAGEILKINNDFLLRTTTQTRIIPGSIELLEHLSPRYRLFILSNGFREVQSKKMENSGLAPYFTRIILSEDAGIQKPHKAIFDHALRTTNSRRTESLMIGDSWEADITGARNARIDQLWFNPSHLPPKGFTPTFTVEALREIMEIL